MIDWNGFLSLAEELATRGDVAAKRSAISRAYYCAYHVARQFLEISGVPVADEGRAHYVVWKHLRDKGRSCRVVGIDGSKLYLLRKQADYDARIHSIDRCTSDAMAMARKILGLLEAEIQRAHPAGPNTDESWNQLGFSRG
ncbi:MAG: hypothetical protein FWD57_11920 [Polyangiaceae bacterium]|nr:hypothetical protein [Polyangiaceae bacterium]